MSKGIIKFALQKIIKDPAASLWEKLVFDATWMEYRMQAANFNQQSKATLFTTIVNENPKAEKLHDAVSTAAIGYIRQLQDVIPGLTNAHGKNIIPFKNFKFNIIQSDMVDSRLHKVEIIFISEPLTLIDVFNNRYLIAVGNKLHQLQEGKEVETELITQVDQLSIYSFIKPVA
ncbi:hypothetical protein [Ferruginibacter sp. SUN106]|uniref:hypothetical protein n=1 Tax=Ferruginibacter sp. SUN106 TaxID=2978348 RepID=UPI003D36C13C